MRYLPIPWCLFLSLLFAPLASGESVDFNRDIRPILADRCFHCHGPDTSKNQADLRLDLEDRAKEFVISPGNVEESELIVRILSTNPEEQMPPPDSGKKTLTPEEGALFARWIEEGAVWDTHWAWSAPKRPKLQQTVAGRNGIDSIVFARLTAEGLSPSKEASKETLIRRASLDLTGLPPTLAEIDAFLKDTSGNAYEKVLDRLLASPHYGERMAIDWLDGARYADSNGFQNDFGRDMHPWRDWVIQAFNQNMPFDQFAIEQLAGDLLPNATDEQRIATGFNRNHRANTEGGSIEEEWRIENIIDRVETTGTVFLGLTIGCARCHEHKYDPITQKDFYRFFAFFNSTKEKGFYEETRGNTGPQVSLMTEKCTKRLAKYDADIAAAQNALGKLRDSQNSLSVADAQAALEKLNSGRSEYVKANVPTVMVLEEMDTPRVTYRLVRGMYDAPDKTEGLSPEVPSFLPPMSAELPKNRLGLAQWLVSPENPLTARVTVNRLWQKMFGDGLVRTSENFGTQGEVPVYPALLDWLATEFVGLGWDLKAIQKTILMSATYRQDSATSAELLARDPENKLYARGPRFRMQAELVRDSALAVSGLLSNKIGGPAVKPYQPAGMWQELAGGASQGPYKPDTGESLYRRSLYTFRKRTVPHATMSTFDAPSFEVCYVRRARTNTPLQALALLNDVTYVEASRQLAERMMDEGGEGPAKRIAYGFRLVMGRTPTEREISVLESGYIDYEAVYAKNPEQALQLLSHGDSKPDDGLDSEKLAAYSTVASVILNLDEAITKQ